MPKVKIIRGTGPYGSAPYVPDDLDDAVEAKVDDAARDRDSELSALRAQVEALSKICGVLAKCCNEAGLFGSGDVADMIGHDYSVEY